MCRITAFLLETLLGLLRVGEMITAALIVSNLFGFLLQFLLPFYLVPSEYSIYSVVLATAQVFLLLFFEPIRLSLLRYSGSKNLFVRQRRGSLFFFSYLFVFFVLVLVGVFSYVTNLYVSAPYIYIISLAALVAAFQGGFEGAQSYARAQFFNKVFAYSWVIRSAATLLFCLAAGFFFQAATHVLAAYALSFFLIFFAVYFVKYKGVFWRGAEELLFFVKYGLSLALAMFLSGLFVPVFKNYLAIEIGPSSAGGFFWAFDLYLKVFAILGMVINLALSQRTISEIENGDREKAIILSTLQVCGVIAVIAPVYIGAIFLQDFVIRYLSPEDYRGLVSNFYFWAVSAAAIISIRMFSADALFVVFSKVKVAFFSPIFTIFLWLVFSLIFGSNQDNILRIFCSSLAIGLFFSIALLCGCVDYFRLSRMLAFVGALVLFFWGSIYFIVRNVDGDFWVLGAVFCLFLIYFAIFFFRQRELSGYVFRGVNRG